VGRLPRAPLGPRAKQYKYDANEQYHHTPPWKRGAKQGKTENAAHEEECLESLVFVIDVLRLVLIVLFAHLSLRIIQDRSP
jgi:hypothetical protein